MNTRKSAKKMRKRVVVMAILIVLLFSLTLSRSVMAQVSAHVTVYGQLIVTLGPTDNITITCDDDGFVKVNDFWPRNPDNHSVKCADIKKIRVTGGPGNNTIDLSGVRHDNFPELHYGRHLIYIAPDVEINGGGGSDFIKGSGVNDEIMGGDGHDQILAGDGDDHIYGGSGNDGVQGGDGNDMIYGHNGNDIMYGGKGNDEIHGRDGDDYANGGDGDDLIHEQMHSADIIADSVGVDTLSFSLDSLGVTIELDLMDEWQIVNTESDSVRLEGLFEHFIGSGFDDVVFVSPGTVPHSRDGGDHEIGDTLHFDAKGEVVTDDGSTLTIEGYESVTYANFEAVIIDNPSSVELQDLRGGIPTEYRLFQNYPNPFNAETIIQFAVKNSCRVVLKVYNLQGKEIETLIDGFYSTGTYKAKWNDANLASGIYFYQIQMGGFQSVRKMVVLE